MFCLLWIIHRKQKLRDEKIGTLNKKNHKEEQNSTRKTKTTNNTSKRKNQGEKGSYYFIYWS